MTETNKYKYLTDNNKGEDISNLGDSEIDSINKIANVSIDELMKKYPNLLFLSEKADDRIEDQNICNLYADKIIQTYNLVGFIGIDNLKLTIGSRFTKEEGKEYFLQYMLQKIFSLNIVDLKTSYDSDNLWEFLLYLIFPYFLKKAFRQGIFKCYERHEYNDSNVKGQINLNRHFKNNIPFVGNVAYSTRELSYNNAITHLIRHTIEFIQNKGYSSVLSGDTDVINAIQTIREITPDYTIRRRQRIIQRNIKKLRHPYFTEYEPLRKICIQILNLESNSFNKSSEQIHGVLIDVSWLWEEYLNTILLKNGIMHPENKSGKGGLNLFANENRKIYPDFYHKEKSLVLDAKYKFINEHDLNKEDLYQMFTYMYRLNATTGILIYPRKNQTNNKLFFMHQESCGGTNAQLGTYGMYIPQKEEQFEVFRERIKASENELLVDEIFGSSNNK